VVPLVVIRKDIWPHKSSVVPNDQASSWLTQVDVEDGF